MLNDRFGVLKICCLVLTLQCVVAQQPCPSPCPDQGRQLFKDAGKSQVTTVNCAQFTIAILGQSLTTPPSCPDSYVFRDATEFHCGGTLAKHCCVTNDHKVTLKIYGPTNTCPIFPDPLPTTLQQATKDLQCGEPKLTRQTFNWSAGVKPCSGGASNLSAAELAHGESSGGPDGYTNWQGKPDALLGSGDASLMVPWYASIATAAPTSLPSPLREVYVMCPPLPACSIVAQVTIAYPLSGESYVYEMQGVVAGDGRFSLSEIGTYDHPSGNAKIGMDLSFDHKGFYYGQQGRPYYTAFAAIRPDTGQLLTTVGASVMPILDWAQGPCVISLLEEIQRSTQVATAVVDGQSVQVVRVTEALPGSGWNGTREYDLVEIGGRCQPVTIRSVDSSGGTESIKRLSDYVEFEPGGYHYRPMTVTVEEYEPGSQGPKRVVTLRITQANSIGLADVPSWRKGSSLNWWHVYQ